MALRIAPSDALINGVINAESSGNPNAISSAGALGLMQIMPATGAMYGASPTDLQDPTTNRRVGTEYLTYLLNKYGGDKFKALVAYNEGPGRVDKGTYYPESVKYAHGILGKLPQTSIVQDSDTPVQEDSKPTQGNAPMSDPLQFQAAATSPQQTQSSAPAQAPQQSGILGGIEGLLGHPLVQAALATYLGAISSPRREGWGGAIGHGGLAGLGQFAQAEKLQQELPLQQAQTQEAQAKATGETAKQAAIQQLPPQERGYAYTGVLPQYMQMSNIRMANQSAATPFLLAHPNDPVAAQIGNSALNAPSYVGNDLEKQYQAAKLFPQKQQELTTNIAKGKAETTRAEAEAKKAGQPQTSGVDIYNLSDPTQTRQVAAPKGGNYQPPPGWAIGRPSASVSPVTEYGPGGTTARTRSLTPDKGYTFAHPSTSGTTPESALRKEAEAQAEDFVKSGWYGSIAAREAAKQQYINAYMAKHGAAATPASGSVKNSIAGSL